MLGAESWEKDLKDTVLSQWRDSSIPLKAQPFPPKAPHQTVGLQPNSTTLSFPSCPFPTFQKLQHGLGMKQNMLNKADINNFYYYYRKIKATVFKILSNISKFKFFVINSN